jgi:cytochrome c oxidase assembly factor CtaG
VVAVVVAVVPPVWAEARRYEFISTVHFCLFAFAVPPLLVLGRPWAFLRAATGGGWGSNRLELLAQRRRLHPYLRRSLVYAVVDLALVVLWRMPAWADAVARNGWLLVPEALSLAVAGAGVWLELAGAPPLSPRLARPWQAVLAAACMWATWILAYVVGFAHMSWYRAFHHVGTVVGASMDQQLSAGVLWFAAACVFVPVVFADLVSWLEHDEDPDAELRQLVRAARRSGRR